MLNKKFNDITDFLTKFDALKQVNRRSYINGGERLENSAEHSWHLAMACWAFAEYLGAKCLGSDFDVSKLIKLALVHDLGEMEAGDTFLYSAHRESAHIAERLSLEKLAAHPGNPLIDLVPLWEEQEAGTSAEARLLKVIDRLLPLLHNMTSEGRAWRDHGIHKDQVLKMHQFIQHENPEIHQWIISSVDYAVEKGWLKSS